MINDSKGSGAKFLVNSTPFSSAQHLFHQWVIVATCDIVNLGLKLYARTKFYNSSIEVNVTHTKKKKRVRGM